MNSNSSKYTLDPYITPVGAWALSLGTSVGWGSLVVTCNTYLLKSGPWGSVLGMVIGGLIMLIISRNYHYMANCFPDSGGAYTYSKEAFGYDHGFLTAWFLGLTYIAVLWANATSLPLFARYFLGDSFRFGFEYTILGYHVYMGEILFSLAAILLTVLLCIRYKKLAMNILIVVVFAFVIGIIVCFTAAMIMRDGKVHSFEPGFIPNKDALSQVIRIACITPWAFIGFENISNVSEEFKFPHKKMFRILTISVISTTVLYVCVMMLSVTAYPEEYGSWMQYINNIENIEGYKGLPAFYAAHYYLGNTGIYLMMMALLGLVISSLIGNITALSRLLYAFGKDGIIPERFRKISKWETPAKATLLIFVISLPIPFFGRTAISWIVDVTVIGATIVYGLVSASTYRVAKQRNNSAEKWTGLLGVLLMIGFGLYLLVPQFTQKGTMAVETYMLFTIWGVLGFIYFRIILMKDKQWRYGKTIVVWVGLLTIILFIAIIGMNQSMMVDTDRVMSTIHDHYVNSDKTHFHIRDNEEFLMEKMQFLQTQNLKSSFLIFGLFLFAIVTMLANYSLMRKRAETSNEELDMTKSLAYTDVLTGVKSVHAFDQAEKTIDDKIKNGTMHEFGIVVCDINGLKEINDTMGHVVGDEYIRAGSSLICDHFVHSPVYRIGGDEFVVILDGRDYMSREDLLQKLIERSRDNASHHKVVLAAGMSEYIPDVDMSILNVMERADEEMYEMKKILKEKKE